jgi:hypothetical protein
VLTADVPPPTVNKMAAKKKATRGGVPSRKAAAPRTASGTASAPGKAGPVEAVVDTFTDGAMLAAFDLVLCKGERNRTEAGRRALLLSGRAALISIRRDCSYRVRVTEGELTPLEREHLAPGPIEVGLEVTSGRLYVGGDSPPGYPEDFYDGEGGRILSVPKGTYRVTAHSIDVPRRLRKELPDFVLALAPIAERLTLQASTVASPFDGKKREVLPNRLAG